VWRGRIIEPSIKWLMATLLVLLPCVSARAQTSTTEFLPEIDASVRVDPDIRFVFQAKQTREGGAPTQAEVGPSIEFFLKPLIRLREITASDVDVSKSRPLVFAIGYRYVGSPGKPEINRMEPVVTIHIPTKGRLLITDKNRGDLDWSNGTFDWRYRNRITVERRFEIHSYHPGPYISAELIYDEKYSKVSSTNLFAGCLLPLGKHFQLDPYYEHENNTGKTPNQQVNAGGLALNISF